MARFGKKVSVNISKEDIDRLESLVERLENATDKAKKVTIDLNKALERASVESRVKSGRGKPW